MHTMNRRKRQTQKERRRMAARRLNSPVAIPSNYLHRLKRLIQRGVVIEVGRYSRVSESGAQQHRKNYLDQWRKLRKGIKKLGAKVGKAFWDVDYGCNVDRPGLKNAIAWAKAKPGRILVAETTDRWLRHPEFGRSNLKALPTEAQFEELLELADGVLLATLWHPDLPPGKVRSRQIKRGHSEKGNRGGRPRTETPGDKKRWREKKLPLVLYWHKREGSRREIAAATGVPFNTVARWIRQYA
jgi:DNA invertase Pin-like site-specific DNA recombinase